MDSFQDAQPNRRKAVLTAAVIVLLVLAVAAFAAVIVRRGRLPSSGSLSGGQQQLRQGGQDEAPVLARVASAGGSGETLDIQAEPGEPVDPTINRQLTADEKAAAGYPTDWSVRLQAFRTPEGEVYLRHVVDSQSSDADGDLLSDAEERESGTDAAKADTDGDGLTDYEEARLYGTDPKKADTDGDGASDGDEVLNKRTDPKRNPADAPADKAVDLPGAPAGR